MSRLRPFAALVALLALSGARQAMAAPTPVDFNRQILPIFARACVACHGPEKANGGLQLVNARRLQKGGISDDLVVPGKARGSYLMQRLRGEGNEPRMPIKAENEKEAKALSPSELALIERWIDEGAHYPDDAPPRFIPAPGGLKRLSQAQYHNTLRDLLGPGVPLPAHLEPDTLVAGSAVVGAARVALSGHGVEKYGQAAFTLARAALADAGFRARHAACAGDDDACLRTYVTNFGRRAFRRPLRDDEIERYTRLGHKAGALDPARIAVTAAMLQSPLFLYRAEIGEPDPADATRRRLTAHELAARLSYFLWGAPPDDELIAATDSGALASDAGIAAQTRRMLQSPRTHATMSAFFVELFRLRRLDKLYESRSKHKLWTPTLMESLKGETLRLIEEIAFSPTRDFREIFSADFTFVNRELARHYQLPISSETEDDAPGEFRRVSLPQSSRRRGLLAQGSFLSIFAHPNSSSPTKRGKFVREALLCQAVPPPPPNVDTKLPKDQGKPTKTTRQKLEAHRKDIRCNGCHKSMDPIGFAFERWDGLGHETVSGPDDAGLPIDTSGELDGESYADAAGLGALLAKSPKIGACMARSLFRFAVGHLESEGEEPLLEELARGLERDGYKFEALVENVIKSEGFRTIAAPVDPPRRLADNAPR